MKKVLIGGHWYKIVIKKDLALTHAASGLCDLLNKIIYLEDPKNKQVLLHEIFHASLYEAGIVQGLDGDVEEIIVENLSMAVERIFDVRPKRK